MDERIEQLKAGEVDEAGCMLYALKRKLDTVLGSIATLSV
jgi:hypothetical protein